MFIGLSLQTPFSYGSRGSFASKNNEATAGLNSAEIGDIRVINSIGKYPNSVEQRMRKPSFVVIAMWSSLEVTRAFRSAGIPYRTASHIAITTKEGFRIRCST